MAKREKRIRKGTDRHELEDKAQQLLKLGSIYDLKNGRFKVESQSQKGMFYEVCFLDGWTCTCPHYLNLHSDCKHIVAVQMLVMKVPGIVPVEFVIKKPKPKCPKCGSTNCKPADARPRTKGGVSQRYRCFEHKHRFTYRPGFLGKHYADEAITDVLDDVAKGKSYEDTVTSLEKRPYGGTGRIPGRSTADRWAREAAASTAKIYEKIPLAVSKHWSVDELHFRTMGRGRYIFGVMDNDSRFIIATKTAYDKLHYDGTSLLKKAVKHAGKIPRILASDKLPGFATGFQNVIQTKKRRRGGKIPSELCVYHINSAAVNKRHIQNNRRERLNSTLKEPTKTSRGFNTKNPALFGLRVLYYNFIRRHLALGRKSPAQILGIRVQGPDKWATLVAFAATC